MDSPLLHALPPTCCGCRKARVATATTTQPSLENYVYEDIPFLIRLLTHIKWALNPGGHHKRCQHLLGGEGWRMRNKWWHKLVKKWWAGVGRVNNIVWSHLWMPPLISSNFLVVGTHLPCQLWNAQDFRRSQQIQHALQLLRGVVPRCAGSAMAPPDFSRSVNPISTSGCRLCSPNNTGIPGFSDLPTALNYTVWYAILAIMDAWHVNSQNQVNSNSRAENIWILRAKKHVESVTVKTC